MEAATRRSRRLASVVAGCARLVLALCGAALIFVSLTACSASDDGSAAQDVPRVGLMHVGTDHTPSSFGALARQLDEKYGWSLPRPTSTVAPTRRCS